MTKLGLLDVSELDDGLFARLWRRRLIKRRRTGRSYVRMDTRLQFRAFEELHITPGLVKPVVRDL